MTSSFATALVMVYGSLVLALASEIDPRLDKPAWAAVYLVTMLFLTLNLWRLRAKRRNRT